MVSKRLMLAREAIRAFNDGWLNTISGMSAADVIYIDDESGITALGPDDFKRVAANMRRALPGALTAPTYEERGDVVEVR
ncbi:MAG: ester cyclase, partial [Actinobacteria bacterium]|nr:ester cyclase [Actinomycetota bacterium]